MINARGKRLLVLGGTYSSLDVVMEAKRMGVYVAATDKEKTNIAKEAADASYSVDTTDMDGLAMLVQEECFDGVFTGPSEFNLKNAMQVCSLTGRPFYITAEQWEVCSNKRKFKELCRQYDVPCVPEFHVTEELLSSDLEKIVYPVIVKPEDGGGSRGISVCKNEQELAAAIQLALKYSKSKQFLVEKCIRNDYGFSCRYVACNGELYLSAVNDRYTVDRAGGKALISAVAMFPSKRIDEYIADINQNVIRMFKSIGIQNGCFFLQALADDDGNLYFHEMNPRLSGGLVYPMLQETCGYSDVEMMIRYAVGLPMADDEAIKKIDPYLNGKFVGSVCIPLKTGVIGQVEGLQEVRDNPSVLSIAEQHYIGDNITPDMLGTLSQHFCRVKLMAEGKEEFIEKVNWIQDMIKITDREGKDMIYKRFDTARLGGGINTLPE